jgi:hypothetical protein
MNHAHELMQLPCQPRRGKKVGVDILARANFFCRVTTRGKPKILRPKFREFSFGPTYGGDECGIECVLREPEKNTGFSHPRVSNEEQFEEIVIGLGHPQARQGSRIKDQSSSKKNAHFSLGLGPRIFLGHWC